MEFLTQHREEKNYKSCIFEQFHRCYNVTACSGNTVIKMNWECGSQHWASKLYQFCQ